MIIQFYGPLRELAEKETDVHITYPVQLIEIIRTLRMKYPELGPYLEEEKKSGSFPSMMFMRQGRPLNLHDILEDEDEITVLLPISGG